MSKSMFESPFASPDVTRLDLDGGHWVEVRNEIGVKEQKRIDSALLGGVRGVQDLVGRDDISTDEIEMRLDGSAAFLIKLKTYIVDWSFRDRNGKSMKVTPSAIEALKPSVAEAILDKLNAFLDALEAEHNSPPFESASGLQSG